MMTVSSGESMAWKKGETGNPKGRPNKKTEEKYLRLLREAVSDEDWKEAVKQMVIRAKCGDVAAFKAVADYLAPKPAQRTELTGSEGGPVKLKVVYESKRQDDS